MSSSPSRIYRGRGVEELIELIHAELGPEAIILGRREGVTNGVLGFFQRPYVEIEAIPGSAPGPQQSFPAGASRAQQPSGDGLGGNDFPHGTLTQAQAGGAYPPGADPAERRFATPAGEFGYSERRIRAEPLQRQGADSSALTSGLHERRGASVAPGGGYLSGRLAAFAQAGTQAGQRTPEDPDRFARIAAEFNDLVPPSQPFSVEREMLLAREPSEPTAPVREPTFVREQEPAAPSAQLPQPPRETIAPALEGSAVEYLPPAPVPRFVPPAPERRTVPAGSHARARAGVEKSLRRLGVSEELAGELIDAALAHTLPLAPRLGLAQAVRATLAQRIPVAPPLPTRGGGIALVGAGGSGKTTFCAALVAAYRAGSTLKPSFASIARGGEGGAELELLLAPAVMKPLPADSPRAVRALHKARAEGLVVIDTPRLTPSDRAAVRELGKLLSELEPERIVVALPVTLGPTAAEQLLAALRPLGAESLALTHADETDQIGVAVESACRFELAPEFVLEHGPAGGWRLTRIDPSTLAARLLP